MSWVMSQVSMSHVTPKMSHVALWEESCHTGWCLESCHIQDYVTLIADGMCHVTGVAWVMSHTGWCHTQSWWYGSCHRFRMSRVTYRMMSHLKLMVWVMSHKDELCHTHSWWNTSCRRSEWVTSRLEWDMLHCGRSYVIRIADEIRHVAGFNESYHT